MRNVQLSAVRPFVAIVALTMLLGLTGCGTRLNHRDVVAAAGGEVRLAPESVAAVAAAVRGSAPGPSSGTAVSRTPPRQPARVDDGRMPPAAALRVPAPSYRKSTASPAASAPTCSGPQAPIRLGQIGSFSGLLAPLSVGARTAVAAWVQAVNARGGLACHPVVLYAVDDGADPARAAALVEELKARGVVALVGAYCILSMTGVVAGIERTGLPVVGGDGVDLAWTRHRLLFPVGPGPTGLIRGILRHALSLGHSQIGLVYCVDSATCGTSAGILRGQTPQLGGRMVYESPVSLTQPDFTAQCQNARAAGVTAFALALDGAAIGRLARSCAAIGYRPPLLASVISFGAAAGEDPDIRHDTVIAASAVAPWTNQDTPGQQEYRSALRTYAPQLQPDAPSIVGWAAGKLIEAAVEHLGPSARRRALSTSDVLAGLGSMRGETLGGLSPPMTFSPNQNAAPAIDCTFWELLTDSGWSAPRGSRPTC